MYLRALPTNGMAASMLGNMPNDDKQTVLVIFTANKAVIAGRIRWLLILFHYH
jgi:hypothetical protein